MLYLKLFELRFHSIHYVCPLTTKIIRQANQNYPRILLVQCSSIFLWSRASKSPSVCIDFVEFPLDSGPDKLWSLLEFLESHLISSFIFSFPRSCSPPFLSPFPSDVSFLSPEISSSTSRPEFWFHRVHNFNTPPEVNHHSILLLLPSPLVRVLILLSLGFLVARLGLCCCLLSAFLLLLCCSFDYCLLILLLAVLSTLTYYFILLSSSPCCA